MKRIVFNILICFTVLISFMAINNNTYATETIGLTYTVKTQKQTVYPGEEIQFTVTLKQTGKLTGIKAILDIPEGLTYKQGSIKITDEAKQKLGFDLLNADDENNDKQPITPQFTGVGSDNFEGTEEISIVTFSCTVNSTAQAKDYTITLTKIEAIDDEFEDKNPEVIPVTVNVKNRPVSATKISLNKTELSLLQGESETLIATLEPTNTTETIMWESSNNEIVSVDNNGTVIAKKKGNAKIIVTTTNGLTTQCQVNVQCAHTGAKEMHQAVASTCLIQGNDQYEICQDCGAILPEGANTKLPLADHKYEKIVRKDPIHIGGVSEAGTKEHFKCSTCNKLFIEVNNNKIETTQEDLIIKAEEHTYGGWITTNDSNHWKECTICGLKTQNEAHIRGEIEQENIVNATCTAEGKYTQIVKCTICKKELSREEKQIPIKEHVPNTPVRENIVNATCSKEGTYEEVIYCKNCNTQISRTNKTIEKLSHNSEEWESDEQNHWKNCGSCGIIMDNGTHIPGNAVREKVIPATCNKSGSYEEVTYCTVCNKELSRTEKIESAKGHTAGKTTQENTIEAKCEEPGSYEEVIYCLTCNEEIQRNKKEISARGHKQGEKIIENEIPATGIKEGSYEEVIYCTQCNKELVRQKKTTPKFVYEVLEGENSKYEKNTNGEITFKINGEIEKFIEIKIDEETVAPKNYTIKSGSTIISLNQNYLNTLAEGSHILKVSYIDGEINTNFEIIKETSVDDTQNKGENDQKEENNNIIPLGDNLLIWVSIFVISGICLLTIIIWKIKKQK